VARRPEFSAQMLSVLAALGADPTAWRHGYGIAKDTGLKSGTLYPILIRLSDRGLVEARWEQEQPAGRRHLYRLTPGWLASARTAAQDAPAAACAGSGAGLPRERRVAPRAATCAG
jgi:PadR family transcriptional regulator